MKLNKSRIVAACVGAFVVGALSSGSALAQGMYVYGAIGQSDFKVDGGKAGIDQALTNAGVTGLSSSLDKTDTAYKLQLGYMFSPNFGVEGGWVDLGKLSYSAAFTGPVAGTGTATWKARGFNIAAIGVMPLNNSFSLFGRLGAIDAKVSSGISATAGGAAASGNDPDSTKWKTNYGLGVMYNLSPKMAIRAEWERFDKLGDSNNNGTADVDLWSIGLKVSF